MNSDSPFSDETFKREHPTWHQEHPNWNREHPDHQVREDGDNRKRR